MLKYGRTAMTISDTVRPKQHLPRLAVCPGFKAGAFGSTHEVEETPGQRLGRGMDSYFDVKGVGEGEETAKAAATTVAAATLETTTATFAAETKPKSQHQH